MIVEYLRPKAMEEAMKLLDRETPKTIPLGGGTVVSKNTSENIAVVDLQDLGLKSISKVDDRIALGAAATLSEAESYLNSADFSEAVQIQAGKNLRNSGTLAGMICTTDGRSPLLTLLLALDAYLTWEPGNKVIPLGEWLPLRKEEKPGKLITKITIPEVKHRFSSVGRSPKDQPIVCCAVAKWPGKRLRITAGGFGEIPVLVLDGILTDDIELAMKNALHDATDQWASAEYRMQAGSKLCARLVKEIMVENE